MKLKTLINLKEGKKKQQMRQIQDKQQDDRFKFNHINNHIDILMVKRLQLEQKL